MNISVDLSCDDMGYDADRISSLASLALAHEGAPDNCELSVSLIDIDEMTRLNERYRKKQGPTDVLSFPVDDAWDESCAAQPQIILGDIMICPQVASAQAAGYGNTYGDEMDLLLVHGCLHLLGHDHIEDDEAAVMQQKEKEILAVWGGRK